MIRKMNTKIKSCSMVCSRKNTVGFAYRGSASKRRLLRKGSNLILNCSKGKAFLQHIALAKNRRRLGITTLENK